MRVRAGRFPLTLGINRYMIVFGSGFWVLVMELTLRETHTSCRHWLLGQSKLWAAVEIHPYQALALLLVTLHLYQKTGWKWSGWWLLWWLRAQMGFQSLSVEDNTGWLSVRQERISRGWQLVGCWAAQWHCNTGTTEYLVQLACEGTGDTSTGILHSLSCRKTTRKLPEYSLKCFTAVVPPPSPGIQLPF